VKPVAQLLHLLLEAKFLQLQAHQGCAVRSRPAIFLSDALFEMGVPFLKGAQTGVSHAGTFRD
jgi:hypothetical protein